MRSSFTFLFGIFLGIATLYGCRDKCNDQNCQHGTCVSRDCVCEPGYEGFACSIPFNAKFHGTYTVAESCDSTGDSTYQVILVPDSSGLLQVFMTGLHHSSETTTIHIDEDGLTYFLDGFQDAAGEVIPLAKGTISADGHELNLAYTFRHSGTGLQERCFSVMNRVQ